MSFLEMLDVVNEGLVKKGEDAISFDSDCREGICGACSLVVNGIPHGPDRGTTVCQLHMRKFKDGETITIEPWRAKAFPIVKDLVVDRSAFDRIIAAGGYVSINCGGAQDGNDDPDSPSRPPIWRWMPPRASDAAPVWLRVRTRPRISSWARRFHTWRSCRRDRLNEVSASSRWSNKRTRRDLAAARTKGNAKRSARSRFRSRTSRA